MAKKQLLALLLFGLLTIWQVLQPRDGSLVASQGVLARREAAESEELEAEVESLGNATEEDDQLPSETEAPTTAVTTSEPTAEPTFTSVVADVGYRRRTVRLPNHLAELPGSKAWRPPDFQDLPALPPEVWNASRAEMPLGKRYPLVESVLRRLEKQEKLRIEVYGGSMTVGSECCMEQCKMNEGPCAWPSLFSALLHDAFPSVSLVSLARGGCNLECAVSEMVVQQKSAKVPVDWIILDFSQNGWGGQDHKLEEFIRICHLFLPKTLVLLIYNRDMGSLSHTYRDDHSLKVLRAVAEHYSLPMLNYEKAMEEFARLGGSQFSMWPRKVQPTAWPDWSYRHPRWPGHAFYADMLADWVNQQLSQLDTVAAAEPLLLPELRKPKDVTADEDWIQPMQKQSLENVDLCLFPLTTHLARNPESHTPLQSPAGHWRLFEDRRNKPGWIVTTKNDTLFFKVNFSAKPKLALQYLRSYENLGTAELKIISPYVWHCKQLGGQGSGKRVWKLPGLWPPRISITVGAVFVLDPRNASAVNGSVEGIVAIRLVEGSKFKLLSVISC